jgi:hypothetical protein
MDMASSTQEYLFIVKSIIEISTISKKVINIQLNNLFL